MRPLLAALLLACAACGAPREHAGNPQAEPGPFRLALEKPSVHRYQPGLSYGHGPMASRSGRVEFGAAPVSLEAGATAAFALSVANTGQETWPAKRPVLPVREGESRFHATGDFPVTVASAWLSGGRPIGEPQLWLLPHDVPPGEALDLTLEAAAPAAPGKYLLRLSLHQAPEGAFASAERPIELSAHKPAPSKR